MRWGSAGGARILGLPQCGAISVGMQADLAIYRLDDPRYLAASISRLAWWPAAVGLAESVAAQWAADR